MRPACHLVTSIDKHVIAICHFANFLLPFCFLWLWTAETPGSFETYKPKELDLDGMAKDLGVGSTVVVVVVVVTAV